VTPPIVTEVVVKLTTPEPELLALKLPEKVAEKLSLPAVGIVWVIVSVNVPDRLITPLPEKKVWKLPKLDPVGVFRLVEPRPVKVSIMALPIPPKNVTEFVPLPEQPAQVNVPEVLKVTGSAFAVSAATVAITRNKRLAKVVFKKRVIGVSLL
jgi:hypothetical protein